MKTLSTVFIASAMTLSSFTNRPVELTSLEAESQHTAQQVVKAFQQQSSADYVQLFPLASDFLKIMDEHHHIYGDLLEEAIIDFKDQYVTELVPEVAESFTKQLEIGRQRGINWEKIQYQHMVLTQTSNGGLTLKITCVSEGYTFCILIEQAIRFNSKVSVSQHVVLV